MAFESMDDKVSSDAPSIAESNQDWQAYLFSDCPGFFPLKQKRSQSLIYDFSGAKTGPEVVRLKNFTNREFVEEIERQTSVSPLLEWSITAGAVAGKASVKAWVFGKAGEHLGDVGRVAGLASGLAVGIVSGAYSAYETAELLEGAAKVRAYEARLQENVLGTYVDHHRDSNPWGVMHEMAPDYPSVRDVVDWSKCKLDVLCGQKIFASEEPYKKAFANRYLDDAEYLRWARRESSWSQQSAWQHHLAFGAMGLWGGLFTAQKLHLGPQGTLLLGAGGIALGVGLSYLGINAQEQGELAELLKYRLLSDPYARPFI